MTPIPPCCRHPQILCGNIRRRPCAGPCPNACARRPSGPQPVLLLFTKADRETGAGLPGAVFQLRAPDGSSMTGVSNALGFVQFTLSPCICYLLTEIAPPAGYAPSGISFQIMMDLCGRLFVNGECTRRLMLPNDRLQTAGSFTAVKVNILTGLPLAGAEFTLSAGAQVIATAVSTQTGAVAFTDLPPGAYRLEETVTPQGYQPSEALAVTVAGDGAVTVDGQPADGFRLANIPVFRFAFFKVAAGTMAGLPGAAFRLSSDEAVVGTAVSDEAGLVDFGPVAPGTYHLAETAPPAGHLPDPAVHTVVIAAEGGITVDGSPLEGFVVADTPVYPYTVNYYANSISAGNLVGAVTGTGPLGGFIDADLTLFAPAGYNTPGTRSGATYITNIPANNVVNVLYTRLLAWYIEYYVDDLTPANLLARARMPGVDYGTVITLTPAQLDAFRPNFYQSGVQVGGPVAITTYEQVIRVLYLPLELQTVTVNHYTESAYGSGSFTLNSTTQWSAYEGDVLTGSSLAINLGPNYSFGFASPSQLTVTSGGNVINLFYMRTAA